MKNMTVPDEGLQESAVAEPFQCQTDMDVYSGSTHAKVVRLVGTGKRVLGLGCANGPMLQVFRDRGCQVVAVESGLEAAARASAFCERVIEGDIERIDLARELGEDSYDVAVISDFLEHLKEPLSVLLTVKRFLRPGGYVIALIPDTAHDSVPVALLNGSSPPNELSLVDINSLQFCNREGMEKLLEGAGFAFVHLERQEGGIENS